MCAGVSYPTASVEDFVGGDRGPIGAGRCDDLELEGVVCYGVSHEGRARDIRGMLGGGDAGRLSAALAVVVVDAHHGHLTRLTWVPVGVCVMSESACECAFVFVCML